jgi:hypothetical protein
MSHPAVAPLGARGACAIWYYLNLQELRSMCLGVSLLALIAVLVIGFFT